MIIGVHITKSTTWRGVEEEFENVYHYNMGALAQDAHYQELIDDIVAVERTIHVARVNFKTARIHGPTNLTLADGTKDKAADVMRYVTDLTGAGTMTDNLAIGPEDAIVGRIYLGRSDKGYKQFLRKFYHSGSIFGVGGTTTMALGIDPMPLANKQPLIDAMNQLKNLMVGADNVTICNSWGKGLPVGSDPEVDDFVRTRQLRRGRQGRTTPVTNPG